MLQWTWESTTPPTVESLAEVLNRRMAALQGILASITMGDTRPKEKVQTTDATVTTLATEAIPPNVTVLVWGYVVARRTSGAAGAANDGAAYRVEFVAKNAAGTAILLAAATVTVIGESQAGWDCTVDASGGGIRVRVTGAAQNTISWKWARRVFSVADMNV